MSLHDAIIQVLLIVIPGVVLVLINNFSRRSD
jgi:hypothetical protein